MGKLSPSDIIVVFLFNPVDTITGELSFGNIWQLQEHLSINAQAIWSLRSKIGHTVIVYDTLAYM